ncbi:hypothetical protein GYH30_033067 [Glycine max]|nr:hypothetical protein GYH30_033067 [Glycine max]
MRLRRSTDSSAPSSFFGYDLKEQRGFCVLRVSERNEVNGKGLGLQ